MDGGAALRLPAGAREPEIVGLTADSRAVQRGFLFAALPGSKTDGKRFIADAIARGAAAVLVDDATGIDATVPAITDTNPRRQFARMVAKFHAPQPKIIAAVTGTNGKTSVTVFLRQIWQRLGDKAASLGTIGLFAPGIERPGSLTTPDPVTLHRDLAELASAGVDHVALEASSHGLDQFRLDGLALTAAAFTNLTRDHLDYHADMEAYFTAKARLFGELLPPGGTAVFNIDAAQTARLSMLSKSRGQRIITYGRNPASDIWLSDAIPEGLGQRITFSGFGEKRTLWLPLLGTFQAWNALAALALAIACGAPAGAAFDAVASLTGVPGRMQRIGDASVIVDYAHTPDALQTALTALRPFCSGRLIVVFGCGGDRDPGKRPQMGAIAEKLADDVIVTDDNPRSEDPAAIRRAILAACPKAREIGDRADAIRAAITMLRPGDLLLVAGKGHERGQIVGDKTLPFDDAAMARAILAEAGA
ncbi:MAG TPA: UDP-N-acetylmuramoyl-L-alanyl-D-glutamate--2,6-diaminopimelate ligase [Stellaceae bacterium]|jgi:UDP-N-acetylmuramoyl-L-alanyl-D-glutamate--2,6-diaminopimelate ligase|nr:UDP-N-acetylmuramoyl-L-alanyl-D-glutamate--2,6-diaminopimelate ligase [Stellaceae bacterium]